MIPDPPAAGAPPWLAAAETAAAHLGIDVAPGSAPRSRRWHVDHGVVHGLDWGGRGDVLVLLHGVGQNAHDWDLIALALRDRYRVVALDLRGHGESSWATVDGYLADDYARDVEAVCRQERWQPHVVGASLGGAIALALAIGAPDLVRSLVLVDVAIHEGEIFERIQGAITDEHATTDLETLRERAATRRRLLPEDYARHLVLHRVRRVDEASVAWKHDVAVVGRAAVPDKLDLLSRARRLTMPVLMVRGEHSRVLDDDSLVEMRRALPRAELVEVPDAGHLVASDNPRECGAQLRTWLAGRAAGEVVGHGADR